MDTPPPGPGLPDEADAPAARPAARSRGFRSRAATGLLRRPAGLIGLAIVALIVLAALFAPAIAPHDPVQQRITRRGQPPAWMSGNWSHPLGTDHLGRDVLSRILFGARASVVLSGSVVVMAAASGTLLGLLAGMRGGLVDVVIMRVADALLAVPFMVVAIAVIAVFGAGLTQLTLLLTVFGWVQFARVVRGDVLSAREKEYVEAARCLGARGLRIALRHILPNVLSPVIVLATFAVAALIIIESALSFLGLGIQPPTPSWGGMLSDGRNYLDTAWWLSVFPGLAITLMVMGVNFLGDALRDVLDPRQRL
jgi:peptide/nickel transport system permease protein